MEYIRNTTNIEIPYATAITLGKFDGLHTGHQYLFECLYKRKEENLKTVVFTFDRPPRNEIEHCEHDVLSTTEEKAYLFEQSGVDYFVEFPFTKEVMEMEAEDFILFLYQKLSMRVVIVGTDFRFGHNRRGDYHMLQQFGKQYGFEVQVVEKKQYKGEDISSSLIRQEISAGRLEIANELLGYPYFVSGEVLYGNQIGRKIGFPTVNLVPQQEKKLPPFGVYAVSVEINKVKYNAIANVGVKPTIDKISPAGVEAYIFDFDGDLYGKNIKVSFLHCVRKELHFQSLEDLKQQINTDINNVLNYFKSSRC